MTTRTYSLKKRINHSLKSHRLSSFRLPLPLAVLVLLSCQVFVNQGPAFAQSTVLFGSQSVAPSQDSNSAGSAESFPVTAMSSGQLSSVTLYVDTPNSAKQITIGVYSNSSGRPKLLLTQGSISAIQSGAWNTIPLPPISVTSGIAYWIALLNTSGTLYFRDATTRGCSSISSAQSNLTALPASWSSGSSWNTCQLSAYGSGSLTSTQPILAVTPLSLSFSASQGGLNPSPSVVSLSNTGTGALTFTASSDSPWLSVSPTTGTAPQNLTVTTSVASLTAGTYSGNINITAAGSQGSPQAVAVTFVVSAPPPPVPSLASISPTTVVAGTSAFSLTVNGGSFVSGDTVLWNGSALSTTFVSATQLTSAVAASLITTPGSASVTVQAPGGATSNSLGFSITAPTPSLNSISPATAVAGGTTLALTVTGSSLVSGDTVLWNGSALSTTFGSATQLSATVPSSLLSTPGSASVAVQAPGGVTSNSLGFSITAPTPSLISISPTTALAGGGSFTLTMNGGSFVSGDSALWNGSALTTTFVSATQLSAAVPASLITSTGIASVSVQAPGGATSASLNFSITTPTPSITSISPPTSVAGGAAFTLTITGINFVSGDTVLWNGSALSTTFVSATQLSAAVPASLIASVGTASVTVQDPGGDISNSSSFTIASATPVILIGSQVIQSGPDSDSSGQSEAFQALAAYSGVLNSLVVYLDNSTTAKTLFVGLYSDSGGRPATLLTQGSSTTLTSAAWNTVPVPGVNITTGTSYWIAVLGTGGTLRVRDGSGCTSVSSAQSNLTSLPGSWSSGSSWPTCPLSAYGYGGSSSGGSGGAGSFSISGSITPTAGGSGAAVTLSGFSSASTTTSGSGTFSFTGLTNGNYVVTPSNPGYTFVPPSQAITINGAIQVGVNFTAVPAPVTYSLSGTISPASVGAGATVTLSGAASASTTADSGGNFSFTSLNNGTYTVTPSSTTATFSPTSQAITISSANVTGVSFTATATSTVIFYDDFTGTSLDLTAWTVISRHGEYEQDETECNTPQQVSVANSLLTITTAVGPATCGDFNIDGSVRHAPSSWPYITGDIQWKSLNFTYGTLTYRAQYPAKSTRLWPAVWLFGANCQNTNPFTADVGYDTCPTLNSSSYAEIDTTECDLNNWCQLALSNVQSFPTCGYAVDTNFHTYTVTWTSTAVTVLMDGQPTGCSFSSPQWTIPSTPMFVIIQTQTGGAGGTPNDALLPATFNIDFVKVTQP